MHVVMNTCIAYVPYVCKNAKYIDVKRRRGHSPNRKDSRKEETVSEGGGGRGERQSERKHSRGVP